MGGVHVNSSFLIWYFRPWLKKLCQSYHKSVFPLKINFKFIGYANSPWTLSFSQILLEKLICRNDWEIKTLTSNSFAFCVFSSLQNFWLNFLQKRQGFLLDLIEYCPKTCFVLLNEHILKFFSRFFKQVFLFRYEKLINYLRNYLPIKLLIVYYNFLLSWHHQAKIRNHSLHDVPIMHLRIMLFLDINLQFFIKIL